ncbi:MULTISPECIES: ATP-dependent helicase [unclassified Microbacterium]|uniref:ATP-dependent helicase n=1 Tax=unclassified Microbacterium TaxID=2609290 RepID=UPI0021A36136|nr:MULTISPECIES: ATP-dependent helicase [unclassified Microbacterium]MCT1365044.1 ATP-dependent helicase [Microbacterium sp. p3-SID131]MCT1377061.1 ATP-dependent helicase [Microbacterium sp. p3-SID337]
MSGEVQWNPADGVGLEPNALKAVTAVDGHVVVTAGPGAGKTELLAQRADFLLRTGACAYPRRILAISFKVDAARNLRERVKRRAGAQLATRFDSFTFHAFAKRLIDNYREALTGEFALDADYQIEMKTQIERRQITFDDLVPFGGEVLSSAPFALQALRQTYSHVFLDEFQDSTRAQYSLVKEAFLSSEAKITAVGDGKQRIMAWAGAVEGIMEEAAADFGAEVLELRQNHRSAPRLRRMQNRMIAEMEPGAEVPVDELQGDEGTIRRLDYRNDLEEADALAELISEWIDEGVPVAEIVVLVRQWPDLYAAPLMDALAVRDIPALVDSEHQKLVADPAAALIFNFVRVVVSSRQPGAYADLMQVFDLFDENDEAALRRDRDVKKFLAMASATVRAESWDSESWPQLIQDFLNLVSAPVLMGLSASYLRGDELQTAVDDAIHALSEAIAETGGEKSALARLSGVDAVRILTIHKSKGLEFEKVVMLGTEEETHWGPQREAECIFFVGISRAKTELVMTTARHRPTPVGLAGRGRWDEHRRRHGRFLSFADEE